jgi:hypothetical protein
MQVQQSATHCEDMPSFPELIRLVVRSTNEVNYTPTRWMNHFLGCGATTNKAFNGSVLFPEIQMQADGVPVSTSTWCLVLPSAILLV